MNLKQIMIAYLRRNGCSHTCQRCSSRLFRDSKRTIWLWRRRSNIWICRRYSVIVLWGKWTQMATNESTMTSLCCSCWKCSWARFNRRCKLRLSAMILTAMNRSASEKSKQSYGIFRRYGMKNKRGWWILGGGGRWGMRLRRKKLMPGRSIGLSKLYLIFIKVACTSTSSAAPPKWSPANSLSPFTIASIITFPAPKIS